MTESETTARSKRRIWIGTGAAVVVVGLMVAVFAGRFGEDPRMIDSPLIGEQVSALQLEYLEGEGSVSFDQLKGEVVVVNFWASWCIPCRSEHRDLTSAAATFGPSGVRFVGVVFQDEVDAATAFLDDLGRGPDNYFYVLDPGSRAAVEFGVFGVPETFFVDREGRIVHKIAGPVDGRRLTAAITAILNGEDPS